MKRIRWSIIIVTILLLLLTACSGESNSPPEDPLVTAEREFNYAIDNLSDVQNWLHNEISVAEALLEAVAEEDVADTAVLSDLRTALENSSNAPEAVVPEMKSTLEEIQLQQQSVSELANTISSFYYDLHSAVSRVEESQQAKRAEYENMNIFDAAESMGYTVEEIACAGLYYVSFCYNDASFLISSAQEPMPNNEHGTLSAAGFSRFCMTSRWMLKSDVRSCGLGIVSGLPRLLGAFSISTPDGEHNYERSTIFMNIRNEIKAYIVREGFTMSELVEKLAEQYGWSPSVPNLSDKLRRESLRYKEAVELSHVSNTNDIGHKHRQIVRHRVGVDYPDQVLLDEVMGLRIRSNIEKIFTSKITINNSQTILKHYANLSAVY